MSATLELTFLKVRRAEKAGDIEEAHRLLTALLARYPKNRKAADALARLGGGGQQTSAFQNEYNALASLYGRGCYAELIRQAEMLLVRAPHAVEIQGLIGAAYLGLDDFSGAEQAFRQAINLQPQDATQHNNLGIALRKQDKLDEAEQCYSEAIRLQADYVDAYYNRANLRGQLKRTEEAVADYKAALQYKPDYAVAHYNLANLYRDNKIYKQALYHYKVALDLDYSNHDILFNMGSIQLDLKNIDAAILAFEAANLVKADDFDTYANLASALSLNEEFEKSRDTYRKALKIRPDEDSIKAEILSLQGYMCEWEGRDEFRSLPLIPAEGKRPIQPFLALSFEDDPARQLVRSQSAAQRICLAEKQNVRFPPPEPGRKIRIGYFSSDLQDHATLHLMAGMFREHDRQRFDIRAYSFFGANDSTERQKIIGQVDIFTDVHDLTDAQLIDLARQDELDIAVDLKGYTRDTRLRIFAERVAPVQIGYIGYPGSIGADFLDYIIADPVVIPQGLEQHYSEKVIRLPSSYQANDNQRIIGSCTQDRTELGLPEDGFVFCSFNQNYKISPREFSIWMRLLQQVEGSVLWLIHSNQWAADNLRAEAQKRGVDPSRLIFAEKLPHADHLARHKHADLFLDSFAVNAHTTASDALWGGLPVLTLAGRQFAARVGASLLTAIGLPDLITTSEEEYEAKALELAQSPEKLAAIRKRLAENRLTMPLYDTVAHTRAIEAAYEAAHARRMQGLKPDHISIS